MVGAVALGLAGLVGLMPMDDRDRRRRVRRPDVDWWVPLVVLGVVTAAVPYTTGIAAEPPPRVAARVVRRALEVVAGVLFAWLLLDELPRAIQLLGGLLILAGVVGVKLGERTTAVDHSVELP